MRYRLRSSSQQDNRCARSESRKPAIACYSVLLALLTIALLLTACGDDPDARVKVGYPAPAIELPDLEGKNVELSDYRGQVVLLNFWALWCDPCKAEMPDFQEALDTYGPQGFSVVTVDLGDQAKRVKTFIDEHGYGFTTLIDSALEIGQVYDTRILPLSLLLDREGIIRVIRVTPFEPGTLPAEIEGLLSEGS